jgi:hypothetical protein
MKVHSVAMLSLLVASTYVAQLPYTEEQVIAYAKLIDVQALDPTLPSQGLEEWLQSGPPRAHILSWSMAKTCDLKPTDQSIDYPLCAKVTFSRDGEYGQFLTQVGTSQSGIAGPPHLHYGVGVWEGIFVRTGGSERLSDLPALLDQPAVTGDVQKLYEKIVAHHPIGLPTSAEMASMRTHLSERLTKNLQTARDCLDDYNRQHVTTTETVKPEWLKSGLFSGNSNHATPVDALTERKEKQNDGSYLVYVDLEPADAVIHLGHGHMAFHGGYSWQVVARVIFENGRYVVDDVRIFDRFPAEGPSRLLSASFSGCDGPLWTGEAATNK